MGYKQNSPQSVAEGGTGAQTLTGVLTGNGTSAVTANAITDLRVIRGDASNAVQDSTMIITDDGEMTNPSQPAFLAYLGSSDTNATGNGTVWTLGSGTALTEVFDQGGDFVTTGTFTAPVTGKYQLGFSIVVGNGSTTATSGFIYINTSNQNFTVNQQNTVNVRPQSTIWQCQGQTLADMDASDTCVFQVAVSGRGSDIMGVVGSSGQVQCYGSLIC